MDDKNNKSDLYPSNSLYSKPSAPAPKKEEEKKVEKVTVGKVKKKEQTLFAKFTSTFLATDFHSVVEHIVFDVLVPTVKDTISDMIKGSVNMMLFGDRDGNEKDRRSKDSSRSRGAYVSYDRYYDRDRDKDKRDREAARPRGGAIVDEIIFDSKRDAEEVLDCLIREIREYELVSVDKYYSYAGVTADYTKNRYGWYNLNEARIIRLDASTFTIRLPRPVVID